MKKNTALITILFFYLFNFNIAQAQEQSLAEGKLDAAFSSWGKSSLHGGWSIIKSDGRLFIQLGENFQAKTGPDVKIFLSPISVDDLTGDNAAIDSVFIQQLSSFKGPARIEIPANIDLSKYNSLVFHCEAYSKLWGSSPLSLIKESQDKPSN